MNNNDKLASLLKALLNATPDLIFAKDKNLNYIAHNEAFSKLVGKPNQDLTGLSDLDIFENQASINNVRAIDSQILSTGETITKQETTVYPDGRTVKVDTLKAPFYNEVGELMGVLGISRDVTRRVDAEKQLKIAKEKAEGASLAKSEFLAKMSHEIRTPMNAVIGLSQLLSRTDLSSEQQDFVDKILGSAEVLLSIINDILDFSKVEANSLTLEKVPFSLQKVIDRTITICELRALDKNLEFILDLSSQVPNYLIGDPNRLQQILVNLANNAIKFTDKGHILVKIELDEIKNNLAKIHFSVTDTGIGISEKEQKSLFAAFSQIDNSLTREFEGSGLGLAISKQLVELMGGRIQVESKPDQGSTFSFNIECEIVEDAEQNQDNYVNFTQLKTLVVDDSAVARSIVMEMLSELGMQVDCADSGLDAINMVKKASEVRRDYDLIIMDWRMPGLDGISAAKQIKHGLGKTHIPAILLLSAYDLDEAKRKSELGTIDAYLEKPVTPHTLIEAIAESLTPEQLTPNRKRGTSTLAKWDAGQLDYSSAKILVVDDNAINRKVVTGFLQDTKINIDIAIDGEDAVAKVLSTHYDLVLMDVQMPKMDGYTATKLIKQNDKYNKLPIIAMTAHAMEGDKQLSLDAGMNGHLTKPLDADELFDVLLKWIPNVTESVPLFSKVTIDEKDDDTSYILSKLSAITSLNLDAALNRCQGKTKLYCKLAADFVLEHQHSVSEFLAFSENNESDKLFIKVHALKSSSAYIGAFELSKNCASIENKIDSQEDYSKLLTLVCKQLQNLLYELGSVFDQAKDKKSIKNALSTSDYLRQLLPLLQSSDFAAEDLLPEIVKSCMSDELKLQIQQVERFVHEIEFEQAAELCEQIVNKISANPNLQEV
ncbi:response regulator [Catenovulum maritimum]|uniref:response regulator n=1 Tax=Catenovulum maritimum TaxID=1513271 RepID=UPI00155A665F|nr:response regulator [Catenovulum maritimum]